MENQFAKQRIIKDVTPNDDRVQVTGYIKNIEGDTIILDDKTGIIKVVTKNIKLHNKQGDLIRVIGGMIMETGGGNIIQAEIIQDMTQLNFNYYIKLYEIKKELKLIE
jgi:hypothetical protein